MMLHFSQPIYHRIKLLSTQRYYVYRNPRRRLTHLLLHLNTRGKGYQCRIRLQYFIKLVSRTGNPLSRSESLWHLPSYTDVQDTAALRWISPQRLLFRELLRFISDCICFLFEKGDSFIMGFRLFSGFSLISFKLKLGFF